MYLFNDYVFIIVELFVNYNNDFDLVVDMIKVMVKVGVNVVKV